MSNVYDPVKNEEARSKGNIRLNDLIETLLLTYQTCVQKGINENSAELMKYFRRSWDIEMCKLNIGLLTEYDKSLTQYKNRLVHGCKEDKNTAETKTLVSRVIHILRRMHSIDFSINILKYFIDEIENKKIIEAMNKITVPVHLPTSTQKGIIIPQKK